MRALVTGATGFVGGAICRGLVRQGWLVRALRRESSQLTLLNGLPVELFTGDLNHIETILAASEGVDAVFHAAAMMNGDHSLKAAMQITVSGTRNVLEAALQAKVKRVVHVSSVAALGVPNDLPVGAQPLEMDETHTWNELPSHWVYGYAKYLAEMEVQKAVSEGLDTVIVNPGVILGAGDIYRQHNSVLQKIARGKLRVSTDGGLNLIHIEDVVSGVLAAYEGGNTGERYILGNVNTTLTSFVRLAARVAGVPEPQWIIPAGLIRAARRGYKALEHLLDLPVSAELLYQAGRYFYYTRQKASQELDWKPARTIESAVREAIEWFKHPIGIPYLSEQSKEDSQSIV